MLNEKINEILLRSKKYGWVLEPDAKEILREAGLPVPRFGWAKDMGQVLEISAEIGFPLAVKVVSPAVIHKSEVQGVAVGVGSDAELDSFYKRVSTLPDFKGILIEEMGSGLELIVGAKVDYQFGPIVVVGIGGTGVEIYQDVSMRMAPLSQRDIDSMLINLKGSRLLSGYRGAEPVNMEALSEVLQGFSEFLMDVASFIESIDLNPLFCSSGGCVVADARIMLAKDFVNGGVS